MSYMQIKGIAKRYGTYEAVRGIDIDIAEREFVVIVGPSGCGKSTLLRMIAGLETISRGDLVIDGQRMNDVRPAERGIAMVFQSYALYPHMSVKKNIMFPLKMAGMDLARHGLGFHPALATAVLGGKALEVTRGRTSGPDAAACAALGFALNPSQVNAPGNCWSLSMRVR